MMNEKNSKEEMELSFAPAELTFSTNLSMFF